MELHGAKEKLAMQGEEKRKLEEHLGSMESAQHMAHSQMQQLQVLSGVWF